MQAYEPSAFWARSGAADAHRYEDDDYPPMLSGGFGDHATALSAAGGICAALVKARDSGNLPRYKHRESIYIRKPEHDTAGIWAAFSASGSAFFSRSQPSLISAI